MKVILVLHNIRNVYNVGSIFRTADAAGAEKIYLTGITPAPLDRFGGFRRDFRKVALGAERTVPWERVHSVARALQAFCDTGYAIYAVEQSQGSIPYYRLRAKNKKIALLLGNEMKGLSQSILKHADKILEIPMRGTKESLNVAVAAGIVLFKIRHH